MYIYKLHVGLFEGIVWIGKYLSKRLYQQQEQYAWKNLAATAVAAAAGEFSELTTA